MYEPNDFLEEFEDMSADDGFFDDPPSKNA